MYDVIIVGAGPIGSYAARRLAENGHRVLVLEKKRGVGESVCCTGIIGQECVDAFNIEDRVILRRVNSARLFSPSEKMLRLKRAEPQACILDRTAFDVDMAKHAQLAGAEYSLGFLVENIAFKKDMVSIEASHRGKGARFEARATIVASGFGSGLSARLGLGRFGDFTIGVQTEVKTIGVEEVEVYFGEVAPDFFAWLVPTTPSMARVGLMSRKRPGLYMKKWLLQLVAKGRITSAEAELSYGGIPLKPLPRTCAERLLVVGDAAGQVKPTSGGGIYYGLLCADIAARILHQALENDELSAKFLARYERAWRKKLGRELRIGYWTRKLYERLSDRQIDRIFQIVKEKGIDEVLLRDEDLSFDWHSRAVLRLLKYQTVSRAINLIKIPFKNS